MRIGFDNDKYLALQAEHIRERIGKLYLEFGGKLFDDYHASRVLPGFQPDSKIRMLQQMAEDVEISIAINANDIEKNKVRGKEAVISTDDSKVTICVIPTNEEIMIARDTKELVEGAKK